MAHLTVKLSDEILRGARQRAMERGTSVDVLVEEYLGTLTGGDPKTQQEAIRGILERASKSTSSSQGRRWTRDELHDRD